MRGGGGGWYRAGVGMNVGTAKIGQRGCFPELVQVVVINQHIVTIAGTRLVTCSFTFYHMTTHMILSRYLCLSSLSLIYIPMESSRISITPYDDTLLIVLTCSTFIPTYAKSSLPYAHLILRSPLAD
jgi:hypothetical protein